MKPIPARKPSKTWKPKSKNKAVKKKVAKGME